jgi:hypothetical protein
MTCSNCIARANRAKIDCWLEKSIIFPTVYYTCSFPCKWWFIELLPLIKICPSYVRSYRNIPCFKFQRKKIRRYTHLNCVHCTWRDTITANPWQELLHSYKQVELTIIISYSKFQNSRVQSLLVHCNQPRGNTNSSQWLPPLADHCRHRYGEIIA